MKKKIFYLKKQKVNKHLWIKAFVKTKFKRFNKRKISGLNFNSIATQLRYGFYGLKILQPLKLKQIHIDAFRETIFRKKLLKKKKHKMWFRGVLNIPVSRKPDEIRMGKGKGKVKHWTMNLKPGKIFVELNKMSFYSAKRIFKAIKAALGVPCLIIRRIYPRKKFRFNIYKARA